MRSDGTDEASAARGHGDDERSASSRCVRPRRDAKRDEGAADAMRRSPSQFASRGVNLEVGLVEVCASVHVSALRLHLIGKPQLLERRPRFLNLLF